MPLLTGCPSGPSIGPFRFMFIMPASMLHRVFIPPLPSGPPGPPPGPRGALLLVSCWLICAMEEMGSKFLFMPPGPPMLPQVEVGVAGLSGVSCMLLLLPGPPGGIW